MLPPSFYSPTGIKYLVAIYKLDIAIPLPAPNLGFRSPSPNNKDQITLAAKATKDVERQHAGRSPTSLIETQKLIHQPWRTRALHYDGYLFLPRALFLSCSSSPC